MTIALIAIGTFLRLWQYLANSSLWIDEAALARNILDRPAAALFESLDYSQSAPVGFLLVEKAAASILGTTEKALRAIPLLCGIFGIFVFWLVARRVVSGWAVVFAVGMFSLAIPLIYFSSQLKQYSSDVLAAMLLLLGTIEIRRRGATPARAWLLGVAGAVLVWVSQPAVLILAGLGASLLIVVWRERDRRTANALLITWTVWGLGSIAAAVFALKSVTSVDREFFRWFWASGFMPMPPKSAADLTWVLRQLTLAFGSFSTGMGLTDGGLNYRWSFVFVGAMCVGLWTLWENRREMGLFLLVPMVVTLALSALEIYPFTARLLAFLMPSFLLATAAGAEAIVLAFAERVAFAMPLGLALFGGPPIYAAATALPPVWLQHVRPLIEHVNARSNPEDALYVYYGASQAFHYYAHRYSVPNHVRIGGCDTGRPREFLREIDSLSTQPRLWVLATNSRRRGAELALIVEYLDRIGTRLERIEIPGSTGVLMEGAYLYLYDLGDRARLTSVSAASHPIAQGPVTIPITRWECYSVFSSGSTGAPR